MNGVSVDTAILKKIKELVLFLYRNIEDKDSSTNFVYLTKTGCEVINYLALKCNISLKEKELYIQYLVFSVENIIHKDFSAHEYMRIMEDVGKTKDISDSAKDYYSKFFEE